MPDVLFDAPPDDGIRRQALFSPDRRHRYWLTRRWAAAGDEIVFVALNPSSANATIDDQTIRRCIRFTRDWGYTAFAMLNLFALVSTDPDQLLTADDPIGPDNDHWLRTYVRRAPLVVAAWGAHPQAEDRARTVIETGLLGDYRVLGETKHGHPRHPSRLSKTCVPVPPTSTWRTV